MSIARDDAKALIARVLGGQLNDDVLAMADEAIYRGFTDWQIARDWEFLLKDTSLGFSVASCILDGITAVVNAPSTGAFDGVNKGVTVTGTGVAANTTVSVVTRNTDGTVASITLSSIPSAGTVTLTFGANIPVYSGIDVYNLPTDFFKHYDLRFIGNLKWPLTFIRQREWDRKTWNQVIALSSIAYTIYNPYSAVTQNKGRYWLKLLGVPPANDTLYLKYYRRFDKAADPLDLPDDFVYEFIDYCRAILIRLKRAQDDPAAYLADVKEQTARTMLSDQEQTEDEDIALKSQMELWNGGRNLWNNGEFTRYYGEW